MIRDPRLAALAALADELGATMQVSGNTMVSVPGAGAAQGAVQVTASPGAAGPMAQIGVDKAAIVFVVAAVGGLVGLRFVFGGSKLPPLRIDATQAVAVFLAYQTINIPLRLLAYKFYGHQASQAYLLLA